ncbi:MAG: TldD/PmbA family protein [Asgard group archaeon]|nr:TldD/PmbA family protein [Asgard group archaeon]
MNEFDKTIRIIEPEKLIDKALKKGASYADVRYQMYSNEEIEIENKALQRYSSINFGGIGIRAVVNGAVGFASTSDLTKAKIEKTLEDALKLAGSFESKKGILADRKSLNKEKIYQVKIDPIEVSAEEKVGLLLETNNSGFISDEIKNVLTIFGSSKDYRYFISSDGSETKVMVPTIGVVQITTAVTEGKMETSMHRLGACEGYEFIKGQDLIHFSEDLSKLAINTVNSNAPPAGTYPVIVDQALNGILIHEAFGHAAEADLVFTGTSTLKDRLGEQLANEEVTVIDVGTIEGGYQVPWDDEGTPKGKTVILENGILKSYINDRNSANVLAVSPTGNSRAQDFQNQPIVRMTNTYIDAGTHTFEELLEDIDNGIYIKSKGSGGGQVETGVGTFTFNGGESFMIKNGELAEQVRGVIISGSILNTLKTVDAVGKDLKIETSYFGACGKGGQAARVGVGGPHIRIREMTIGGR